MKRKAYLALSLLVWMLFAVCMTGFAQKEDTGTQHRITGTGTGSSEHRSLGEVSQRRIRMKRSSNYSEQELMTNLDPHFGWSIGSFCLDGYTLETGNKNNERIFLKAQDEPLVLSFELEQDIDCLCGNPSLTVADDKRGVDREYGVSSGSFGRGTLIIKYTDPSGAAVTTVFNDYLSEKAAGGTDQGIALTQPGNYEVALDYVIRKNSLIDSYRDYRVSFSFTVSDIQI